MRRPACLTALLFLLAVPATSPAAAAARHTDPVEEGLATFYAGSLHGRPTASGVPYDSAAFVAAHPTLPFGARVRVVNLRTGASVVVEVVDRGPSARPRARGIIIDVSGAAAAVLGFTQAGRARVRLERLPVAAP